MHSSTAYLVAALAAAGSAMADPILAYGKAFKLVVKAELAGHDLNPPIDGSYLIADKGQLVVTRVDDALPQWYLKAKAEDVPKHNVQIVSNTETGPQAHLTLLDNNFPFYDVSVSTSGNDTDFYFSDPKPLVYLAPLTFAACPKDDKSGVKFIHVSKEFNDVPLPFDCVPVRLIPRCDAMETFPPVWEAVRCYGANGPMPEPPYSA